MHDFDILVDYSGMENGVESLDGLGDHNSSYQSPQKGRDWNMYRFVGTADTVYPEGYCDLHDELVIRGFEEQGRLHWGGRRFGKSTKNKEIKTESKERKTEA